MTEKPIRDGKSQRDRFIEAARAAGASEDEAVFDANLKKIAKAKLPPDKKPAQPNVRADLLNDDGQ